MLPTVHLLTAAGREPILAGTLDRWSAAAGWPGPVCLHHDPATRGHALSRIPAAWCAMLREALDAPGTGPLLFLEDDLDFAPALAARLARWPPLADGFLTGFGSLFNPGVTALPGGGVDWFCATPRSVLGTQALLLARPFAVAALAAWPTLHGFPAMRLAALADRLGQPIHYHRPSLVQHVGQVSSWGAPLRRAVDFAAPGV